MKKLLLSLSLLAALSGCGSKLEDASPVTDPLLGHWQADVLRSTVYDAAGKVKTDETRQQVTKLDVTATTMTFTGVTAGGTPAVEVDAYTRSGEVITYIPPAGATPSKETVYARNLTANSFSLEFHGAKATGVTSYIQSFPFHR